MRREASKGVTGAPPFQAAESRPQLLPRVSPHPTLPFQPRLLCPSPFPSPRSSSQDAPDLESKRVPSIREPL